MIENVDDVSKASENYKRKSQILDVIKTACNINDPLSDISIEKALNKAATYGF